MVRARRADRDATGAAEEAFAEVVTRGFLARTVLREEGAGNVLGWVFITGTALCAGAVAIGVGWVLGKLLYAVWWLAVPTLRRLPKDPVTHRAHPLAGAAVMRRLPYVALCLLALVTTVWLLISVVDGWAAAAVGYLGAQLAVAGAIAASEVRANGWLAVARQRRRGATHMSPIVIHGAQPVTSPASTPAATKPLPVVQSTAGETSSPFVIHG